MHIFFFALCLIYLSLPAYAVETSSVNNLAPVTQRVFNDNKQSIFQIQVVGRGSGEKNAIGSGFLFQNNNHIITNYHVIADAVLKPKQYRIEFLTHDGTRGSVEIENLSVIHDLALLKINDDFQVSAPALKPSLQSLEKGQRIFSIGNPHDLGMMIIEGVFNGLLDRSFYKRILFSGALNAGMSGGPSLNNQGQVIGVNVAAQGEDLGYLVPVEYVLNLFENVPKGKSEWIDVLQRQLEDNSANILDHILDQEWSSKQLGVFDLPHNISPAFKCWSYDKIEAYNNNRNYSSFSCNSQDRVYISDRLKTGIIEFKGSSYSSTKMNRFAFNRYDSIQYGDVGSDVDKQSIHEVKQFQCNSDFLKVAGKNWKGTFCVRGYKKFDAIYDIFFTAALLGKENKGYVLELYTQGFTKKDGQKFIQHFVENVQ